MLRGAFPELQNLDSIPVSGSRASGPSLPPNTVLAFRSWAPQRQGICPFLPTLFLQHLALAATQSMNMPWLHSTYVPGPDVKHLALHVSFEPCHLLKDSHHLWTKWQRPAGAMGNAGAEGLWFPWLSSPKSHHLVNVTCLLFKHMHFSPSRISTP